MKTATLFNLSLVLVMTMMNACEAYEHKTAEQLDRMSPEELIREYSLHVSYHADAAYGDDIESRLMRTPVESLLAIARILDDYDPTTYKGRRGNKAVYAHWALGILWWIDNNHFRVRGTEAGRQALAADQRLIERRKAAHHDDPKKDYDWNMVYRADANQLKRMSGVNSQDEYIVKQLEEDYQIQLTEEEKIRFSDFLVAKDPGYVSWSKRDMEGKWDRFLDIKPYYQAYLEFKKAETQK